MTNNDNEKKVNSPLNKTLAKSRCEKSDALNDFEWVYSGIAYVNVASAEKMVELDLASLPDNPLVREMAFTLRFDLNNVATGDFFYH